MYPTIWGKTGWDFFHFVIEAYPENPTQQDIEDYRTYFYALPAVLPCKRCGRHLVAHYKKYPLTDEIMTSRDKLRRWGIDIHNVVNYYTGKKMLTYSQAETCIRNLIDSRRRQSRRRRRWILLLVLLIVIILIVAFCVVWRGCHARCSKKN